MAEPSHHEGVRRAYDTVAEAYAELVGAEAQPFERAPLDAFAALVAGRGGGWVADVGCGTGRVTAHLAGRGLDVVGVDVSPALGAVARRQHPHLRLTLGSIDALPFAAASLDALVVWYSLIHTPRDRLPAVFAELARVVAPGAPVLAAFQAGDGTAQHLAHAYGHDVDLDAYRLDPAVVADGLDRAGIEVEATTILPVVPPYPTGQAFLTGRRRPARSG
jgi:ubiquinone/menaquinone biosynthesis C-methylase UbiE